MVNLSFQVDTRLALILSENYRSTEIAIKELVDNAWDADAENLSILLPKDLDVNPKIIIEDDGIGMSEREIRSEYLFIANDRRKRKGTITAIKRRKVKGRKGIGKFAGLMAASDMELETWTKGFSHSFKISKDDLIKYKDIEKMPIELMVKKEQTKKKGTRITLSCINDALFLPTPDTLRQILMLEYGRETDFRITVNTKPLGVDDLQGKYTKIEKKVGQVGDVKLEFTINNQKKKFGKSGIAIKIGGKVIGNPVNFGLDKLDNFPTKLLERMYGEIEVDALANDITADWGAVKENSKLFKMVEETFQPILIEKFEEEYGKEIRSAKKKIRRKIKNKINNLSSYKQEYAEREVDRILQKHYGEPYSKLEPIINVVLNALEYSDFGTVVEQLNSTRDSDIEMIAEILGQIGKIELAMMLEQTNIRLAYLKGFEKICNFDAPEPYLHKAIQNNLWLLGHEYSTFISNGKLQNQVRKYLTKAYEGDFGINPPYLLLSENAYQEHLLIEFKRPSHALKLDDYQQAIRYRNVFGQNLEKHLKVIIIGKRRGKDIPLKSLKDENVVMLMYQELIDNARNCLCWLQKQLQNRTK